MNFSTNQANQLYVAKAYKATAVTEADAVGTISVHESTAGNEVYFLYRGVDGVSRTDLINKSQILWASATDAAKLGRPLKKVKVALDANVNSGAPVAGQDYILRLTFREYIGLSPEDQYFKYGMVHATANMTASDFYKVLALSLAKNFSREVSPLIKVYLNDATLVTKDSKAVDLTGTYTKVIIEEAEQPWQLGVFESLPVNFTVTPDEIKVGGLDVVWGVAEDVTPTTTLGNGKRTADLEYFAMGERGDVYRYMGFPKSIKTTYLVDPSLAYNSINLHFYYVGANEMVQKSEKDITLVVPKVGANNAAGNALANTMIDAINTAADTAIAKLSIA